MSCDYCGSNAKLQASWEYKNKIFDGGEEAHTYQQLCLRCADKMVSDKKIFDLLNKWLCDLRTHYFINEKENLIPDADKGGVL